LHASVDCRRKLVVEWVAAGDLEDVTAKEVNNDPTSALQF
jgi:CTP synthase